MIKIQMSVEQFNKINRFGKKYNGVKDARGNLEYTRLKIDGNKLKAEGLDGYKLYEIEMEVENMSGEDGYIYIETTRNFKKSDKRVTITEEEKEIRIESIQGNDIRVFNKADFQFFNTDGVIKDDSPVFEISFDPKKLGDALSAYDDGVVTLEFFGELEQVKITNKLGTKSMLLPVRTQK